MIIYKGKEAVCGIQLTIDKVWRYAMTAQDTLEVKIFDSELKPVIKTYTSSDVDSIDKMVTVRLSEADTASMAVGRGTIRAYMNDLVVLPPIEIYVKEAL